MENTLPTQGQIYQVLISCPGDIGEEISFIKDAIAKWNSINAIKDKIYFITRDWKNDVYPDNLSESPQESINKQIVDECDLAVVLLSSRIGSPTGKASSGTVEEFNRFHAQGKPIMCYSITKEQNLLEKDIEQLKALQNWIDSIKSFCIIKEVKKDELREKFFKDFSLLVDDKFPNNSGEISNLSVLTEENKAFLKRIGGGKGLVHFIDEDDGWTLIANFKEEHFSTGEDIAYNKDQINQMFNMGFLELEGNSGTCFRLTQKAYDYLKKNG